jgi:hypothetical protein
MAAFAESGEVGAVEGGGAGEGLLSQVLGLGGGEEGEEGAGLTGAFDGLASAAETAFGETILGAIEPTTMALADTSQIVTDMTETGLPDELKIKSDLVTNAMVTGFGKAISKGQEYISTLGNIINKLEKMKEAAEAAFRALSRLPGGGGTGSGGDTDSGDTDSGDTDSGRIGGRQHGGPVTAGGTFMVGEAGPELFVPKQAGTIIPNGGFGSTVNWNIGSIIINTNNAVQMFEALEREARARGFRFQTVM